MNSINLIALLITIYQVNFITCQPFCGVQNPVRNGTRPQRLSADFEHPVRYLRVFLVADYELYTKWFARDEDKLLTYMEDRARDANKLYKELNLHLMVVGMAVETDKAHLAKTATMETHLTLMNKRTEKRYGGKDYESLVYFTGYWFEGPAAGVAYLTRVCTDMRAVLIRYLATNTTAFSPSIVNNIVVHEIGHTLGALHDEVDCECPEQCCIMYYATCKASTFHWSQCSRDFLEFFAVHAENSCYERPDSSLATVPICGNGLVEADEECDCHHHDNTCHDCCDPDTCLLTESSCLTTLPPRPPKIFWTPGRKKWAMGLVVILVAIVVIYLFCACSESPAAVPARPQPAVGSGGQVPTAPLGQPAPGHMLPYSVPPQGQSPYPTANFTGNPVEQNGYRQLPRVDSQNGRVSGPGSGFASRPGEQDGGLQSRDSSPNGETEVTSL
ncbi:Zinc metalloproteinase-disintegrin-like crotastatin [Halotydeus destructor]|nr:Zinc metalloproteinase-disintegrin-like crotastatin [Halotydeus destructor]